MRHSKRPARRNTMSCVSDRPRRRHGLPGGMRPLANHTRACDASANGPEATIFRRTHKPFHRHELPADTPRPCSPRDIGALLAQRMLCTNGVGAADATVTRYWRGRRGTDQLRGCNPSVPAGGKGDPIGCRAPLWWPEVIQADLRPSHRPALEGGVSVDWETGAAIVRRKANRLGPASASEARRCGAGTYVRLAW
jgi:hypothetical protein